MTVSGVVRADGQKEEKIFKGFQAARTDVRVEG